MLLICAKIGRGCGPHPPPARTRAYRKIGGLLDAFERSRQRPTPMHPAMAAAMS
jgi:hypothetical protein